MITPLRFLLPVMMAIASFAFAQKDDNYLLGKIIFQTSCSPCHDVHREVVGPQLASIEKKRTTKWLALFIQNSQQVIAGGDPYARFIFTRYHQQVMPSFRDLSESDIKNILHYIAVESKQSSNDIPSGVAVAQESNPSVFHGQLIFQAQCASCHFVDHEGSYGPALGSVSKRHPRQWLHQFIRNSPRVIASGDPYAQAIFNRYDKKEMAVMEFLTTDEIDDVLAYIEFRSSSDHPTAGATGRAAQFGKKLPEIHSTVPDKPLEGAGAVSVFVASILIVGFTIYAILIVKVFRYLS